MGDYLKAESRDVHVFELKDEMELRHFARLVEYAEKKWTHKGLFKIRAPRQWAANQVNFRDVNHHLTTQYETWEACVDQEQTGCFVGVTEDDNQVTKEEFQALATRVAWQAAPGESGQMTISKFFPRRKCNLERRVVTGTVTGSRFSEYADAFDLRNLRSILNLGTLQNGQLRQESGITTPEIVYGSYGSTIPFQTGYMGLYVASYHHGGKPRVWYVIHTKNGNIARFERVLRQAFRHDFVERRVDRCQNPLRHPQWIVSPSFLRRHKVKFSTVVQQAGDILVILPKAYFMAFNCGFNMVESVQFATTRWIDIGKRLRPKMCECRPIWLNPDDLHAAYIEYQHRRHVERANRRLTEENGRLRTELEEERRRCPLRHPHRLRQRLAPRQQAETAVKVLKR